jgi:hypothetical protein
MNANHLESLARILVSEVMRNAYGWSAFGFDHDCHEVEILTANHRWSADQAIIDMVKNKTVLGRKLQVGHANGHFWYEASNARIFIMMAICMGTADGS